MHHIEQMRESYGFQQNFTTHYSLKTLWIEIVEMANLATLVQNGLVKVAF
jgi:hypothetical protein